MAGLGWLAPRILAHLDHTPDFYLDQVAQVVMDRWSSGRVGLLGDAALAPSPLAHLRSLTRRTLGAPQALLAAAGLTLDPAGRTATRDGAPLDLTAARSRCWSTCCGARDM